MRGSHYDMDVNIERYFKETGSSGKSLLNRWYRNNFKKFYQKHENEYEEGNKTFCAIYRLYADGKISRKQFKKIKKHIDPLQSRPVSKFLIMFPQYIHSWLCCGWRIYNPETKAWELNDNVHMLSKLCRHKTWDDVKITWWDKIRFWLITGYKFEKDGESY